MGTLEPDDIKKRTKYNYNKTCEEKELREKVVSLNILVDEHEIYCKNKGMLNLYDGIYENKIESGYIYKFRRSAKLQWNLNELDHISFNIPIELYKHYESIYDIKYENEDVITNDLDNNENENDEQK